MKQAEGEDRVRLQKVGGLEQVCCGRLCTNWREGYMKVDELLRQLAAPDASLMPGTPKERKSS